MPKAIFINLAVSDLGRARRFFGALGFSFDERFSNGEAANLVVSDGIRAMLHTPESLRRFTRKEVADAHATTEVLLAVQLESRSRVDDLIERALAAGATEYREVEDHGFMYARSFEDPDGHIWEAFHMAPSAAPVA